MIRMHNEDMDGPCEDENVEGKGFCITNATTRDIQSFLDESAEDTDIILGFTVGFVTIDKELADFIENLVPTFDKSLSNVVNDPIKSIYSQVSFQQAEFIKNLLKTFLVCVHAEEKLGAFESGSCSFLRSGRELS